MLQRLPGTAALRLLPFSLVLLMPALGGPSLAAPQALSAKETSELRVGTMYTTWDDYYFYAAFRVNDTNVIGTNSSTTSQPQQDDDVEVFFETDDARAKVRTAQSYQMAVSAAQGAYFSIGDGTKTPKGKAVYSYKYAVTVHGKLNSASGTDKGYDVELAIPWSEIGLSGPPKAGATWGFNVISRDRETEATPSSKFYSLSPNVKSRGDVQNPSHWSRLTFAAPGAASSSTPGNVVCAKVIGAFPRVNGTIVSGDWPAATRIAFGSEPISAPAPTVAEEPNTTESPFDNPPPLGMPAPVQTATLPTGMIDLPGGHGFIQVVPGGIKNPAGLEVPVIIPLPPAPKPIKTPKPIRTAQNTSIPDGVVVNSGAFVLGAPKPPPFVMAIYRVDYNANARKGASQNVWNASGATLLADQPMSGSGPWFSGLRPAWHRQQLIEMRQAGVEVALLRTSVNDTLLSRELDALVVALKELKAAGQDYPLIGVDATAGQPDLDVIYAHLPAEFRAMQEVVGKDESGVLVYDLTIGTDSKATLADGTPIARAYYNVGVASVSPGRVDKNGVIGRKGGRAYDTSWQVALVSTPDQIVVDSWNDFLHGSEIAASRQYGEQYADATRAQAIQFDGSRQWHAKYLAHAIPRTIYPKTLYQIPVRIENAGSLPWRAGEGYSLNTRWYKDGRLVDDSAPRIAVGKDVLPGHALTLSIGLVARNNFGEDLEPGDYTLVIDMVQGQDRWFSYAGDTPLQVPVTIIGANAGIGAAQATFLGTTTAGVAQAGTDVPATVQVRNDGAASWPAGYTLGWKIQTVDLDGGNPVTITEGGQALGAAPISPGQIAAISLQIPASDKTGKPLKSGEYRVHWFVSPDTLGSAVNGSYDEPLSVAERLSGASFLLADLPRTVEAGKEATATLALVNLGRTTWKKADTHLGYHWYYLDGTEREWDGSPTAFLSKDLAPGEVDGAISATFIAPKQPGRYALVWDIRQSDGLWQSVQALTIGEDMLQVFITVDGKGTTVPVDLTKNLNSVGIGSGPTSKSGGFDGHGATFPAELMPPDGTAENELNPLLIGKPGLPLYPSGYYTAQVGKDLASNHAISFLYPVVRDGQPNVIACTGQTLSLPSGKYKAIHLLMAAGSTAPISEGFGLQYDRDAPSSAALTVAGWSSVPSTNGATAAYTAPYYYSPAGITPSPVTLGDYTLRLDTGKKLTGLVLPNNSAIKVVGVTLEKE